MTDQDYNSGGGAGRESGDFERSLVDRLLDEELDQLSPVEREALIEALRRRPKLAATHGKLQRLLEPLDQWSAPSPPTYLIDKILDRIVAADVNAPVVRESTLLHISQMEAEDHADYSRGSSFTFRDLLAVAAVLAFFALLIVPGISEARSRAQQVACASNLGSIGRGVHAYSQMNRGQLPQGRMISGGRWLKGGSVRIPFTSNGENRYVLLRFGYIANPKVFVCPSDRNAQSLEIANPQAMQDFPDPRNCSYDSLNMGGPLPRMDDAANLPYMADANPLFEGGQFNDAVSVSANSGNHAGGRGQNVWRLGGQVAWTVTPNVGYDGDNIWQIQGVLKYDGTEVQSSPRDAFLVP